MKESKFNTLVNQYLNESYFGGSPNEQATGIKKHVTFEESEESGMGELIQGMIDEFGQVKPYGYGDKSGNPQAQDEYDEILANYLEGLDLVRAGTHQGALGTMNVYTIDNDIKDEFKPYTLVAYSSEDLGDNPELFPLDKFYSVMIGIPVGEREGVPILKKRIYSGPGKSLTDLSNKEPAQAAPGTSGAGSKEGGLDYDQVRRDVAAAKERGQLK